MADGSEFTAFFLNDKHEKHDDTNPTVILNPQLHAGFIEEMIQDQEVFDYKQEMKKKFEAIEDLKLQSNLLLLQQQILEWSKQKPENETLNKLRDAIIEITFITTKFGLERLSFADTVDDYRSQKLRAIERAQKAEKRIDELLQEIQKLKTKNELGIK